MASQATTPEHQMTISQAIYLYMMDCRARGLRPATLKFYTGYLQRLSSATSDIDNLSPSLVNVLFVQMRDAGAHDYNLHAFYRTLKAFSNWLYEQELTPFNLLKKLRPPKVDRMQKIPPSHEVIRVLLDTCRGRDTASLRDRAVILFLLDTGCRVNELTGITRNVTDGTVLLTGCKGRKDRYAFLSSQTILAIQRYINTRKDTNDALFMGIRGEPLSRDGVISMLKRRAHRAEIVISAHSLRRAAATGWVEQGANLEVVRQLLGHSDLTVTQAYLGVNPEVLKQVHQQVSLVTNIIKGTR